MQEYFQLFRPTLSHAGLLTAMYDYLQLCRITFSYAGLLPVMQGKEEEEKMQEYF